MSVVRTLTAAFLVALLIMFTTIQHLHCLQHASYVECVVEQLLLQLDTKISAFIECSLIRSLNLSCCFVTWLILPVVICLC